MQLTRRRVELFQLQTPLAQANAEQLPFASGSVDHVNCQGDDPPYSQHRGLSPGVSPHPEAWGHAFVFGLLQSLALRSKTFFSLARLAGRLIINFQGRGRESMFTARSPEDLVRYYDGADNPLGKAFTWKEILSMIEGRFQVVDRERYLVPRRSLPFDIPDWLFRFLVRRFGFMIVLRCQENIAAPAR